jgi:hypothetical protein
MYHRIYFLLSGSLMTLGVSSVAVMPESPAGYMALGLSVVLFLIGDTIEKNR